MIKEKREVITDENLDDIYTKYVKESIKKGEEGIKNGEVITLEELKEFIDGLESNYKK